MPPTMEDREDLGHAPETTHDRDFAPINQGSDARGRTDPAASVPLHVPGETPEDRSPDVPRSGTGVPHITKLHPDTLPPDEEGVREAESHDDTR